MLHGMPDKIADGNFVRGMWDDTGLDLCIETRYRKGILLSSPVLEHSIDWNAPMEEEKNVQSSVHLFDVPVYFCVSWNLCNTTG